MRTADEYKKQAQLILKDAKTVRNPKERASLLEIAKIYMKLAALADQRGLGSVRRSADDLP